MMYQVFLRIFLFTLYQFRTTNSLRSRLSSNRNFPTTTQIKSIRNGRLFRHLSMQEQTFSEEQFLELSRATASNSVSNSASSEGLDDESLSRQNELLKSRLKLLEFVVSFLRRKVADLSRALASSDAAREAIAEEEVERQRQFERKLLAFQQMERDKTKVSL